MKGAWRRLGVLAGLLVSTAAGTAWSQTTSDKAAAAESLFREGKSLLGEGKIAEACEKFSASQRLDPALGTLMNLADCLERAGRTASAWAEFLNAATLARRAGQSERVAVAESRAAALEPKLCRLKITVPSTARLEGLELRRDNALVDNAVWDAAVPVDPGQHVISARAPGFLPWTGSVEVTGEGKTASIEVPKLQPMPPEPVPTSAPTVSTVAPVQTIPHAPPPVQPREQGMHVQTKAGLVVGGLGILGVAAGSYFGLSARSKWGDADCTNNICPTQDRQDLAGDAKREANIATAMFVGGGVLLGAGLTLILTSPRALKEPEKAASRPRGWSLAPSMGTQGAGIQLRGLF